MRKRGLHGYRSAGFCPAKPMLESGGEVNELHLFAGAGGGILAGQMLGHRTVCAVEWEPYAQAVLVARQNDGCFPPFPIWDDVQSFDGRPWRGIVDVVAGGFPCQDISVAGKGVGITGERSGMWTHMARIIGEVRPRFAFVENSPALITRGLGVVLGDLAALGYDCRWTVLGAADVGAPHQRDRVWILATDTAFDTGNAWRAKPEGQQRKTRASDGGKELADSASQRQPGPWEYVNPCDCQAHREKQASHVLDVGIDGIWPPEPAVGRVVDGMAHRSHQLKALGNGQVPACAAAAWRLLGGPIA